MHQIKATMAELTIKRQSTSPVPEHTESFPVGSQAMLATNKATVDILAMDSSSRLYTIRLSDGLECQVSADKLLAMPTSTPLSESEKDNKDESDSESDDSASDTDSNSSESDEVDEVDARNMSAARRMSRRMSRRRSGRVSSVGPSEAQEEETPEEDTQEEFEGEDWNEKYQAAVYGGSKLEVLSVVEEFTSLALQAAEEVNRAALPGQRYYYHEASNIMFELMCSDQSLEEMGLTEGDAPPELSSKLLSMVLKGAATYRAAAPRDLSTPLSTLIDLRGSGVRMVATAPCPIDVGEEATTACHALLPDDTMLEDATAARCLQCVAANLNLKSCFGTDKEDRSVALHVAWEAQVHRGEDRRLYLHQCSRALPADMPRSQADMQTALLRPEILLQCGDAVSGNAYQGITESSEDEDLVALEASAYLRQTVIPAAAMQLDMRVVKAYDGLALSTFLHKQGINMRHMGLLYPHIQLPCVQHVLLIEMISRAAKRVMAHRIATSPAGTSPETHILPWLNTILGLSDEETWGSEPSPGSCLETLRIQLERSFDFSLPSSTGSILFPDARLPLALALERRAGVAINEAALRGLGETSATALNASCISLRGTAKSLEGELYRAQLDNLTEGERLQLASLYSTSGDHSTAGGVYNHLAEGSLRQGHIEAAMSHAGNALRSGSPLGVGAIEAHITLLKAECALAEDEMSPCSSDVHLDGANMVARLLFGKSHPIFIDIEQGLGLKYAQRGDWEIASEHFAACVEMAQVCCGEGHCLTAECLLLLGKSCEAAGDVHKALRSYERATTMMWKLQEKAGGKTGVHFPKHVQEKMATCFESYAALLGKHSDKSDWHAAYMWAGRAAAVNRGNTCLEAPVLHRSLHVCAELATLIEDREAATLHYEEILSSLKEEGDASCADEIQRITRLILALKMEALPAQQRLALDSKLARVQGNITVGYDHQQMSKVVQALTEESPSAYMDQLSQRRMSKNYELEIVAMLVHEGA